MSADDTTILCPACGYDLRGTPDDRCPECGTLVDRTLGPPVTPWLRRGNWRIVAFWQTVWLATWRPARVARDVAQPADLRAAKRFRRWLVAWLAPWPIALAALLYLDTVIPSSRYGSAPTTNPLLTIRPGSLPKRWTGGWIVDGNWQPHWTWYLDAACVGVAIAMLVPWIAMSLGVQTYFCHPRRLPRAVQDRVIALGYFAAAPLAWLPLAFAVALAIEWRWQPNLQFWSWDGRLPRIDSWPQLAARVAEALPIVLAIAVYVRAVFAIVRRATHGGVVRPALAVLVTALAWPLLFVLFPLAMLVVLVALEFMAFSAGWLSV